MLTTTIQNHKVAYSLDEYDKLSHFAIITKTKESEEETRTIKMIIEEMVRKYN